MSATDDAVRKAQLRVDKALTQALRSAAIAVESAVVIQSPVDTGRFRANWVASTGTPSTEVVYSSEQQRAIAKQKRAGRQASTLERPTLVTGLARWSGINRLTQRLWLSNNLPYASALAAEHSEQRSPGWIEGAIRTGLRRARNAARV